MTYTTPVFLLAFLPAAYAVWWFSPARFRGYVLLAASLVFYWFCSGRMTLAFVLTGLLVWAAGLQMERTGNAGRRQCILASAVILLTALLLIFKYSVFFETALRTVFHFREASGMEPLLVPAGISFYTLNAIGYLADLYYGRAKAMHNPARLLLWLSFFPQIIEGPFVRCNETSAALWNSERPDYQHRIMAFQLICWGLFKKRVLADRAEIFTRTVFAASGSSSGMMLLIAALLYTLQLYADFSGCIDIARGAAELFGVRLPPNFQQPFSARSVAEFWRRWHMSLGAWTRDYVFYPLLLSRPMQKFCLRLQNRNWAGLARIAPLITALFAAWMVTGLWHGIGFKYFVYGMYYFLLSAAGILLETPAARFCAAVKLNRDTPFWYGIQRIRTFGFVLIGMILFRVNRLSDYPVILVRICTDLHIKDLFRAGTLLNAGLDRGDWLVLAAGFAVLAAAGHLQMRTAVRSALARRPAAVQWGVELLLLLAVVVFGAYGHGYLPVSPIYGQF